MHACLKLPASQLDPAPGATIGGMLSTGCSGSKYELLRAMPPPDIEGLSQCCPVRYRQERMVPERRTY